MPTYEYACTSCSEHLEVVQSFKDDPLTTCPACGGPLRKVFSPIGVVFKGSGFYKTDSRNGSGSGASSATARSGTDSSTTGTKETTGTSSSSSDGTATSSSAAGTSTSTGSSGVAAAS